LGVLIGLAANWLIFTWVIARLPRERVALRSAAKVAVLDAVGFEVLKQGMAIYDPGADHPPRPAPRAEAVLAMLDYLSGAEHGAGSRSRP
jgi:hypothetical protein